MENSHSDTDSESAPGDKGGRAESGLTVREDARFDRLALSRGWLKDSRGKGLDAQKMADLIERNYERGMATDDDRNLASLTRNIIAAVGQVMEQEKRDSGGEQINVNLTAEPLTDEQRIERTRELLRLARSRRLAISDRGGANGVGGAHQPGCDNGNGSLPG